MTDTTKKTERDGKHRFYGHESTGNVASCRECNGTGKIETPSYKGRCLHCDGIGKVVQSR